MEHLALLRPDLYRHPLRGADFGEALCDRVGDLRFFRIARSGRAKLQSERAQFTDPTTDPVPSRLAIKLDFAAAVKPDETKAVRRRRRLLPGTDRHI